ncbi:MAG: hypothetical protein IEMM0002_0673 [bacterium]|nr:MAG: hypothetical protein IEMM0002_0673 [bacterium]
MANSCSLVSSWPAGMGSGVEAMAGRIERALKIRGWNVDFIRPRFAAGGYLAACIKRIMFNLRLRNDRRIGSGPPLVAFDFDGFFFLPV